MPSSIAAHAITREAFLRRAALAAGAAYGGLAAALPGGSANAQSAGGDVDVVNYLLTLEHLAAAFYARALEQVSGLSAGDTALVKELRDNEAAHVDALTATVERLGGQPAARPTFDFGAVFASPAAFLKTANVLEDTGVSAYNGVAQSIESAEVLAALVGIVQVEARHAALVRLARGKPPAPLAFDKTSEMDAVLNAVKPFITG